MPLYIGQLKCKLRLFFLMNRFQKWIKLMNNWLVVKNYMWVLKALLDKSISEMESRKRNKWLYNYKMLYEGYNSKACRQGNMVHRAISRKCWGTHNLITCFLLFLTIHFCPAGIELNKFQSLPWGRRKTTKRQREDCFSFCFWKAGQGWREWRVSACTNQFCSNQWGEEVGKKMNQLLYFLLRFSNNGPPRQRTGLWSRSHKIWSAITFCKKEFI